MAWVVCLEHLAVRGEAAGAAWRGWATWERRYPPANMSGIEPKSIT